MCAHIRTRATTAALMLVLLFPAGVMLGGCNTTAGAGRDISRAGQAIENSANKHAP